MKQKTNCKYGAWWNIVNPGKETYCKICNYCYCCNDHSECIKADEDGYKGQ